VTAGTPRLAPSSKDAASGSGTASRSGTTLYSAAVPHGLPAAASSSHTRCPSRRSSTPSPTASIVPAPSWWGTWKPVLSGIGRGVAPARDFQSVGLTPETAIRTRTWPGPGSGVGTSSTRSTSRAGPVSR
jgi:hypothetical protein